MIQSPPIYENLTDKSGKAKLPWTLFFNQLYEGDPGEDWDPTFQNLTVSGTPTITGRYYKLGYLTYFRVNIVPGTSTTATAGTTYIDNYPLVFQGDGVVFVLAGGLGDGPGHIVSSTNRIYVPGWSAVTVPLSLIGIGEAA